MYGISNLQDLVGLVKEKGSELAAEGKLFADRLSLDRLQEEGGGQAARAGGGKSSGTSAVSQEVGSLTSKSCAVMLLPRPQDIHNPHTSLPPFLPPSLPFCLSQTAELSPSTTGHLLRGRRSTSP